VPESLHERQSSHPRLKNIRNDSGKPLNEDIPVDKRPRKSRGKKTNKVGNTRLNNILEGLAPSIQLYSPSPPVRVGVISTARNVKDTKPKKASKVSKPPRKVSDESQNRIGQMVIDLSIKPEKYKGKDTRRRKNETVSEIGITP